MKKYLIAVAMVVAVSGTFVSCHDDEIANSTVEQKIQAFEDVFTRAFGKPDPNHTWGFGDPINVEGSVTRSVDVNGNLWETRPEVTEAEALAVYNYVNRVKTSIPRYYEDSPVNLKNFFVTQVWGGQRTDVNCNYKDYANNDVFGPEKMNHLQISKSSDRLGDDGVTGSTDAAINSNWDHANNFNAAQNRDWDGNTMFINWGTLNFAYHNSNDSKYHDKWIIVDGADIYDANGNNYPGKYYVCFDFISRAPVKTIIGLRVPGINPGEMTDVDGSGVVKIEGYYTSISDIPENKRTFEYNGTTYTIGEGENYEWYIKDYDGNTNMSVDANNYYTDWIIRLVEARPKAGAFPKVKVITSDETTDGYVIRKIYTGEQVINSGRVFCEDIVSAKYDLEDLDYNDVVFDAAIVQQYRKLVTTYYDKDRQLIPSTTEAPNPKVEYNFTGITDQDDGYNQYYAKVCLLAAGGTLPIELRIGTQFNDDVHNILGGNSPSIMINTLSRDEREKVNMAEVAIVKPAVNIEKTAGEDRDKFYGITSIKDDIILNVEYGNLAAEIKADYYDEEEGDVVATAKFMVPLGTPWAKERTNIATAYPSFKDWVNEETDEDGRVVTPFWNNPNNDPNEDEYFFKDSELVGLDPEIYAKGNFIVGEEETDLGESSQTSSTNTIQEFDPVDPVIPTPIGTVLYDYLQTGNPGPGTPGYLYDGNSVTVETSKSIEKGSTIRVYGVSIADMEVKCEDINNDTFISYTDGSSYIDIPVTKSFGLNELSYKLTFSGKNFTITYVTIAPTTNSTTLWEAGPADHYIGFDIQAGDSKLSNIKDGDIIRIHATQNESFKVKIFYGNSYIPIGQELNNTNVTWVNGSYFDYTLASGEGTAIKDNGVHFQMDGMSALTKVEVIHQ
jgi:hypothetical protein